MNKFIRFKDLKKMGIVNSWQQLYRLIDDHGFPPGTKIGVKVRIWPEFNVALWLANRGLPYPGREPKAWPRPVTAKTQPNDQDVDAW